MTHSSCTLLTAPLMVVTVTQQLRMVPSPHLQRLSWLASNVSTLLFLLNQPTLLIGLVNVFLSILFLLRMKMLRLQKGDCTHLIKKSFRSSKNRSRNCWRVTALNPHKGHMVPPSFLPRKRMGGCGCVLIIVYLINRQKMTFFPCPELMNFCPDLMGQEFLVSWT